MESVGHVVVPLRVGGKKMKKRRELDALVAHSLAKRACSGKKQVGNGITSQDQLLSQSTDDQEESTWSKLPITTTRCRTKRYTCLRSCGLLVLMTSVLILFGLMYWLYFDLRQQIYDHRIKIEQVSSVSNLLPDALQKWHVTSKSLEQNQSNIYNKLSEMHKSLTSFEKELSDVRKEMNKKDVNSNNEKLLVLERNVANFGAQITDLTFNVVGLKEHIYTIQAMDNENQKNLTNLAREFSLISKNYTQSSDVNIEAIQTMIKNISDSFASDLKNMTRTLNLINDTLSQRTKGTDDDLNAIKPKVDGLIENFANMSSHVTSIEDDWTKFKQKAFDFEENSNQINSEIFRLKNSTDSLANSVSAIVIENSIKRTENVNNQLLQKSQNQTYTSVNRTPPNLAILLSAAATDASAEPQSTNNSSTIKTPPILAATDVPTTDNKSSEHPNGLQQNMSGKPKLLRIQKN